MLASDSLSVLVVPTSASVSLKSSRELSEEVVVSDSSDDRKEKEVSDTASPSSNESSRAKSNVVILGVATPKYIIHYNVHMTIIGWVLHMAIWLVCRRDVVINSIIHIMECKTLNIQQH